MYPINTLIIYVYVKSSPVWFISDWRVGNTKPNFSGLTNTQTGPNRLPIETKPNQTTNFVRFQFLVRFTCFIFTPNLHPLSVRRYIFTNLQPCPTSKSRERESRVGGFSTPVPTRSDSSLCFSLNIFLLLHLSTPHLIRLLSSPTSWLRGLRLSLQRGYPHLTHHFWTQGGPNMGGLT